MNEKRELTVEAMTAPTSLCIRITLVLAMRTLAWKIDRRWPAADLRSDVGSVIGRASG